MATSTKITETALTNALTKGKYWSAFDPSLESIYQQSHVETINAVARAGTLIGIAAFLMFAIKDLLVYPTEISIWTASMRAFISPPVLLYVFVTLHRNKSHCPNRSMSAAILVCGFAVSTSLLTLRANNATVDMLDLYLMLLAGYAVTGLSVLNATKVSLIYSAYYLLGLCGIGASAQEVWLSSFYLLCGNGIGIVGCLAIEYNRRQSFLFRSLAEIRSQQDPLTHLPNRRAMLEQFDNLWKQSQRSQKYVAVVVVDIDHFKAFNDHYGHSQGDDCLTAIAQTLQAQIHRPLDFVARYGGEEFVFGLFAMDHEHLAAFCERSRVAIANLSLPHAKSPVHGKVTISIGASIASWSQNLNWTDIFVQADQAMYQAKANGRNAYTIYQADSQKTSSQTEEMITLG